MRRIESKLDTMIRLEGKVDQLMLLLQDGGGKVTKEFVVGVFVLPVEVVNEND